MEYVTGYNELEQLINGVPIQCMVSHNLISRCVSSQAQGTNEKTYESMATESVYWMSITESKRSSIAVRYTHLIIQWPKYLILQ